MTECRIDKALSYLPAIGTRSRASALLELKKVWVNSENPKSSYQLRSTDLLEIELPESQQTSGVLIPMDMKLDILFEDDDILVVNKPAALVMHPAAGHSQDTLVNALLAHTKNLSMKFGENRPGIVHRLDRDTSGVLVVAKNDFAHENLAQQFKERSIHRIYFALVIGRMRTTKGKIESTLARHPTDRKRYASLKATANKNTIEAGKHAVTHFEVLKSGHELSYLKLKLETGRTHQIRVHLSESACPIAADELYGGLKKIKSVKNAKDREILQQFPRFALHAAELGFLHPSTKKILSFKVDWPEDLRDKIHELGFI